MLQLYGTPRPRKVIPRARQKNIGLITMKPFSGGVIPNAKLALWYALSQPDLLVSAGVEEVSLFDENWQTFQGDLTRSAAEKDEMAAMQQQIDKKFCSRCGVCLTRCPYALPIPDLIKENVAWAREQQRPHLRALDSKPGPLTI